MEKNKEDCTLEKHVTYINNILLELQGKILYKMHINADYRNGINHIIIKLYTGIEEKDIYYIQLYMYNDSYDTQYNTYISYKNAHKLINNK